jgi:hypothetical protein
VLHPDAWEARRDSLAAAADSANPEVEARTSRVPRAGQTLRAPGQERGGLPAGLALPRQELIALLEGPLVVNKRYVVRASRVININGVLLGAGQDTIVRLPPPVRPAADSAAAPGDPADTLEQPADTAALGALGLGTLPAAPARAPRRRR